MIKTLMLSTVLLIGKLAGAQTLTWYTNRAGALQAAAAKGQRVLLIVGTAACDNCAQVEALCASPSLSPMVAAEYATWYDDYQVSDDYTNYWPGPMGYTLPLISIIDPLSTNAYPDNYLYETFGPQLSGTFSNKLYHYVGVTNAFLQCAAGPHGPRITATQLSYGQVVSLDRCANVLRTNTPWSAILTYTNTATNLPIKSLSFSDTNAPARAFYRIRCSRQ
jgi:hypothetical protein